MIYLRSMILQARLIRDWGCGGIALLWHKNLGATPVYDISSDRICAVRFGDSTNHHSTVSIIGVYLPCADQGLECYRLHLLELESLVVDSALLRPVIVLGDFNAHLGSLGGARGVGNPNAQGVLLLDLMSRLNLSAISLCEWATGPLHTYISGRTTTTIDYILASIDATSIVSSCKTLPMADLNTSDHLPLVADLSFNCNSPAPHSNEQTRLDWVQANKTGEITEYRQLVREKLSVHSVQVCLDEIENIEAAVSFLSDTLKVCAVESLPSKGVKKPKKTFKDATLSALCSQSRSARQKWRENGSKPEGPLYDEKCRLKREVKKRLRYCTAQAENRRLARREKMFSSSHTDRFKLPGKRKKTCSRLRVNDENISDLPGRLEAWVSHFSKLAKSATDDQDLASLRASVESLVANSFGNEDSVLNDPFTAEEVEGAVKRLKKKKASGPDDLLAEKTDSYRGITLSPVLSKLLEFLILNRLDPVFADANVPHRNQSAYRKKYHVLMPFMPPNK